MLLWWPTGPLCTYSRWPGLPDSQGAQGTAYPRSVFGGTGVPISTSLFSLSPKVLSGCEYPKTFLHFCLKIFHRNLYSFQEHKT